MTRIVVFNSCFINRGHSCEAYVRESGPVGPQDHLVRRGGAWAPDAPCATLRPTCFSCSCSCSRSWPPSSLTPTYFLFIPSSSTFSACTLGDHFFFVSSAPWISLIYVKNISRQRETVSSSQRKDLSKCKCNVWRRLTKFDDKASLILEKNLVTWV